MTKRVLCFGEVLLRLSPAALNGTAPSSLFQAQRRSHSQLPADPAGTFDAWWGGSEANVAVGLAGLGVDASLLTSLPNSDLGDAARLALTDRGVQVLEATPTSTSTGTETLGLYFAHTQAHGKTVIYQRAHSAFAQRPAQPESVNWDSFDALHTSGINPALSTACAQATERLLESARTAGLFTSFDLNLRNQLWPDTRAGSTIAPMLGSIDLLIANAGQLASAFQLDPVELDDSSTATETLRAFSAHTGVGSVIVTDRVQRELGAGARSTENISADQTKIRALWVAPDDAASLETPWFQASDRIGSGDAFSAGLLASAGVLENRRRTLHEALESALAAASLANQSAGDFPTFDRPEVLQRQQSFFSRSPSAL